MKCSTENCPQQPANYKVWLESFPNVVIVCCVLCALNAQRHGARIRRIGKDVG